MARADTPPRWGLISRVAFRFCFVYFGLYCLATQILAALLPVSDLDVPDTATLPPMRQIVFWTAAHVFHAGKTLVYSGSGSGDKTYDWVLAFCLFVMALAATALWSVADRHRPNYAALHKWFRFAIRVALAGQMFVYGASKAIPVQMSFPYLYTLVEPYGHLSPMGVLWSAVGASPAYEVFAGCAEILAGILLIIPRTTMLGALVCLVDMTQVFALNMTYDVPVKLFSFHLILMSLFLLAPDFPRLADFFVRRRSVQPPDDPQLFRSLRANRIILAVQIFFGVVLLGANFLSAWHSWHTYGGGRPKSALYGIWDVEQMSVDDHIRPALFTDQDRWRRAIFDFPTFTAFQRPDDTLVYYRTEIDAKRKTVALTKSSDKKWKAVLSFDRVSPEQLSLDGEMDSHKTHMQLRLADAGKFLVKTRGFHWVQEYPFNQ
jgi:hypothetical protein